MNTASDISEAQKENISSSTKQTGNLEIILSDAEKRIRSNWLRSLVIYFVGRLMLDFGPYLYLTYQGSIESNEAFKDGLLGATGAIMQCSLLFFFAYLMNGTKLIGLFIFYTPVSLIYLFTEIIKDSLSLDLPPVEIFCISIVSSLLILFFGYFWVNCLNLYKLNHTIKKRV